MINTEELRADIEAGTPGDWIAAPYSSVVGAPIASSQNGRSIGQVTYFNLGGKFSGQDRESDANARRIARLPQLEREYLAMREALEFYAKHHANPNDGPWGVQSTDFGDLARKALGETQ